MLPDPLRSIPDGQIDVTAPVTIDGLSNIDPGDPAMPMYRLIPNNRQPVALRDLMIVPVRCREAGGQTVDYFPAAMPHGYYFFPGVHPEENVAYELMAKALAGPFGR